MKIDYLSCTKYLYVAEKLLRDSFFEVLPKEEIDATFAARFGMTVGELQEIWDQFEYGKLLVWDHLATEVEDNYGNMKSEMTYDALTINKKEVEKQIEYLKKRYGLNDTPFAPREAIVSIANQIEQVLS